VAEGLEQVRAALAGRYDIERLLGQGGMATVYLARDVARDRTVAVKVLRPELAVAMGAERFLREIKVAGNLHHPNILQIYDSGSVDGVVFFVMPFITGESLRDKLDREQQLAIDEAVRITREVADALQHAHNNGIVHRDVKPENILLEDGHAIVADFGIARAATESGQKLTETGMSVGTPTYMSPEQAAGGDRIDGRSDQYSLACMLYEMLAGHPPFSGSNSMAILAKHAMETVPSLQVVRQSIPDEVEDAIMQALEKTPADRFHTIKEFGDALGDVAQATATRRAMNRTSGAADRRATPRGVQRRTSGRVAAERPSRKVAYIAAGALVLLAGGGWLAWKTMGNSDANAVPAGPDPKRIAVMYFDTRGGGDSLRYLADGLTEALITKLSEVQPLQVISRNGVAPFRGGTVTPDSVARALNVGTLVQGHVARSPDLLRVTVDMIDAGGALISTKTIERPRADVFALQDSVAAEVSTFLRTRLGEQIQMRESRAGTRNGAAWEMLQRARDEVTSADPLIESGDTAALARQWNRADSLFAEAERLDPRWPEPATQRAWLAYRRARVATGAAEGDWIDRGLGHAERAVGLSPSDPDALEARATLTYWRWLSGLEPDERKAGLLMESAERDFRASVAANPAQASAWTSLSHLLINKPEIAEANAAASRAYEADPYLTNANVTLWRLFTTSLDLENAIQSARWCEEGQRRFPEDPRFLECQLSMFALKGTKPDVPRAWELLDQYVERSPQPDRDFRRRRGSMLVAAALARADLADSARAVILRSRAPDAQSDPTREIAYLEAVARTLLGDTDEAIRQLGVFLAANPAQRTSLRDDNTWWFRDLRSDPRYRTLTGG
jgi:serine/threonine-protein kinase